MLKIKKKMKKDPKNKTKPVSTCLVFIGCLSLLSSIQYRPSTPYVGPQQYSVQPPGSGTFYPGPGPGEYPAPYRESLMQHIHMQW